MAGRGQDRPPEAPPQRLEDENGRRVQARFQRFIEEYRTEDAEPKALYVEAVAEMVNNENVTLFVDYAHLHAADAELATFIADELYRYEPFMRAALRAFIEVHHPEYVESLTTKCRELFIGLYNYPQAIGIRQLRTEQIGRLLAVSGTVTRTTDVRPELLAGSFKCRKCLSRVPLVEQQYGYTEPMRCLNPQCKTKGAWSLDLQESRFVDWQRVRVQEHADEIPPGSLPRSINVILRNELVEKAKAGDRVVFTGMFVALGETGIPGKGENVVTSRRGESSEGVQGLSKLGCKEMTFQTAFMACAVATKTEGAEAGGIKIGDDDESTDTLPNGGLTDEEVEEVRAMRQTPDVYKRLAESIGPNIFGHLDIKRGILLMLLGGVHKKTREGMKLRGDVNVCLVGDPSTAKSQFLKFVHGFLPRGVYTSGKASSAAGLTASVVKDAETGEFCVEAGALMLADNGICCIDEFDKMDQTDQVAIHEAMEQQTISITKAGIHATLNARTSILAAANPVFGRYDRTKSLKANVLISAPIMSRFDLFFVILDECNSNMDEAIARHIVNVHRGQGEAVQPYFTKDQLRRYVRYAKTISPFIPDESKRRMVSCFRSLRENDHLGRNRTAYRITVRQLESMIRLSEALARAHLDSTVQVRYVEEAYRLLKKCVIHVRTEDVSLEEEEDDEDAAAMQEENEEDGMEQQPADDEGEDGAGKRRPPQAGKRRRPGEEGEGEAPGEEEGDDDDDDDMDTGGRAKKAKKKKSSKDGEEGGAGGKKQGKKKQKKEKKKMQITMDEYDRMTKAIATFVRQQGDEGTTWGDIVDWYVEQSAQAGGGEEDTESLERTRKLVNKVLKKMVDQDMTLVPVDEQQEDEGKQPTEEQEEAAGGGDPAAAGASNRRQRMRLLVHPNYVT